MGKKEIAERLQRAREASGKTQEEAASALGTSFQRISNWERGVSRIDTDSLAVLCALYGVSLEWVIKGETSDGQDDELMQLRELLRRRPGMRLLFSAAKNVTEEDLLKVVKMIEVFKEEE